MRLGPEGNLHIVHPNERSRQVLKTLGLDRIVSVEEEAPGPAPGNPLRDAEGNPPREAKRETIIEAHENLVAANPENAVRFKDVLDFLQHKEPPGEAQP